MKILLTALSVFNFATAILPDLHPNIKYTNEYEWPAQFRVSEDGVSASGQFSIKGYEKISQEHANKKLIVIDLRREFHGFVNGYPISWKLNGSYEYNESLTTSEIESGEASLLSEMAGSETERALVERMGGRYIRFPIADHSFPQGEEVDDLIALIESFEPDSWIHVHCAGGSGRTTTILAMLDMMKNSSSGTTDEILRRQEAIGGGNLYDPEVYYADQPERIPGAIERAAFLQRFHQYCLGAVFKF
jgi:hypothetical protein